MIKNRIVATFEFDAAHRLHNHSGKCRFLHGHLYRAEVHIEAVSGLDSTGMVVGGLDSMGMVVDFGVVKERVGAWIKKNFDHQLLLWEEDVECIKSVSKWCKNGSPFLLPGNATAETMAVFLLKKSENLLAGYGVEVSKVSVRETPTCKAEAVL